MLEIAWTAVPVLILVVIAIPSFKLLYFMDRVHEPEMTIKAIGHQWYWSYDTPTTATSPSMPTWWRDEDLQQGQLRLLTTDNAVVLPVDTDIRVLITATDVIHAWAVPAFGVKIDACRAGSTRPGSASTSRASTTASAPSCAATSMASCRSRCAR